MGHPRGACLVCKSTARAVIEAALVRKTAADRLAKRYGISASTIKKHKREHMKRDAAGELVATVDESLEKDLQLLEKGIEEQRANLHGRRDRNFADLFSDSNNLLDIDSPNNPLVYIAERMSAVEFNAMQRGDDRTALVAQGQLATLVKLKLEAQKIAMEQRMMDETSERQEWAVTQSFINEFMTVAGLHDKFMDGLSALTDRGDMAPEEVAHFAYKGACAGALDASRKGLRFLFKKN